MKQIVTLVLLVISYNLCICQSYQDEAFTETFKLNNEGWNAGDGTISIALPDGSTLWMFGDSHVDQGVDNNNQIPCLFNSRNSVMVQDVNNNFTTYYDQSGTDIYKRQFVKMEGDNEITYWPGGGFVYDNIIYTFWESYKISSPSEISFEGMVIAEISLSNIEVLNITPLRNRNLEFGMSIVTDQNNEFHYIYGRKNDGIFRQAYVARCPIGQIYAEWEYYAGNGNWISSFENSTPILDEVSNSYTVFNCGEKFFLLTQERGFLQCGEGREVYLYQSENPHGPFINQKVVYTIEDKFDGNYPITYNAQAHPQFTENDELLISYNTNQTCPGPCANSPLTSRFNADLYRPKFARVPLPSECTTVSNQDVNRDVLFEVYPNPVRQSLFIKNPYSSGNIKYQIHDSLGRIVMTGLTHDKIDITSLKYGVYILRVSSDSYEQVKIISKV